MPIFSKTINKAMRKRKVNVFLRPDILSIDVETGGHGIASLIEINK